MTGGRDRPQACVSAVAIDDDRLLLVRRGHGPAAGRWSVPGGRIESGETMAEALVREVREETGLEAVCDEQLGVAERFDDEGHFIIVAHRVRVLDGTLAAGSDAAEASWVPIDQVSNLRLVDGLAEFLADHGVLPTIV